MKRMSEQDQKHAYMTSSINADEYQLLASKLQNIIAFLEKMESNDHQNFNITDAWQNVF